MFDNATCPLCGRHATTACANCGLKSVPFAIAVQAGSGPLAIAWTALHDGDPSLARGVARVRYCGEVRHWLQQQIGALQAHLRNLRARPVGAHQPQQGKSPLETRLDAFGIREPFLSLPMHEITEEKIREMLVRFDEIAREAHGWRSAPLPKAPSRELTPSEALLAALADQGVQGVDDLHALRRVHQDTEQRLADLEVERQQLQEELQRLAALEAAKAATTAQRPAGEGG